MVGFPETTEAAEYYFTYINRVKTPDIVERIESQFDEIMHVLNGVSEERSLHRYEPGKWTLREVLNHLADTERMMAFRAFWFARSFDTPLPSFDQHVAAGSARANDSPWATHLEDFRAVRRASITLFRNLPADAWLRRGIASDNPFTVRALAYLVAGHVDHHMAIVRERYLAL